MLKQFGLVIPIILFTVNKRKHYQDPSKKNALCISLLFASMIITMLLYINNYYMRILSLLVTGKTSTMIVEGRDNNDQPYRVLITSSNGQYDSVSIITKSRFGFWCKTQESELSRVKSERCGLGWVVIDLTQDVLPAKRVYEVHQVYIGNNAIEEIFIESGIIPDSVSFDIQQKGSSYYLHLSGVGGVEILKDIDSIDIQAILKPFCQQLD